jgi:hypothetical protein
VAILCSIKTLVKARDVYWHPWSQLDDFAFPVCPLFNIDRAPY